MDKLTVADINTYVRKTCFVCILEKYQITGLQIGLGNGCAFGIHRCLGTADVDAVTAKDIIDETGAIETAGISTAPLIGDT